MGLRQRQMVQGNQEGNPLGHQRKIVNQRRSRLLALGEAGYQGEDYGRAQADPKKQYRPALFEQDLQTRSHS